MTFGSLSQTNPENLKGRITGTVVFNEDPEEQQRIKVTVPGLIEGPIDSIPWVLPILPTPSILWVPSVGDKVILQFQEGDVDFGLVEGYIHDFNKVVPEELLVNYPKRRGAWTPAGNRWYSDEETGHFMYIHKDEMFTVDISDVGDVVVTADGDVSITVNGNVTAVVHGQMDVTVDGNLNMHGATINLN